MQRIFFEYDTWALVCALLFLIAIAIFYKSESRFLKPFLGFSKLDLLKGKEGSTKKKNLRMVNKLPLFALFFFLLAFIDPHLEIEKESAPQESKGIAIYIVLDQSGSMSKDMILRNGKRVSKLEVAKEMTQYFIVGDKKQGLVGRKSDLVGLIAFARIPKVLVPLTLDHQMVLKKLNGIQPIENKSEDSTSIGYAIYKGVNLIEATQYYNQEVQPKSIQDSDIKSKIIILITDGFQSVHPLDKENGLRNISVEESAKYAKEKKVRLYVINLDPRFASEELAPHRHLMERVANETGGKFFLMSDSVSLKEVYQEIDQLEKSVIYDSAKNPHLQPHRYVRTSFYPFLIAVGCLILLVYLILKSTLFKELL